MSWIPIIALGIAAFVLAVFALRLPKAGWSLFGAALLFGLAGYALQGFPGYAGAPKIALADISEDNFAMIDARREFYNPQSVPSRYVTISDGFARKGQFEDAANMLGNAVQANPQDAEAWVAMGNALVEHAAGSLTPAALFAYSRAERINPENPAPTYFLGIGFLRAGEPLQTRKLWSDLLEKAPRDAPWRAELQSRLDRLDALIAQLEQQQGAGQ